MSDLADFLLARIAEDEAVAHAANHLGRWQERGDDFVVVVYPDEVTPDGRPISDEDVVADGVFNPANTAHIARHDPARVLAECEAKRRIVEDCRYAIKYEGGEVPSYAAKTLRLLALPYVDHEGYRPEWKP